MIIQIDLNGEVNGKDGFYWMKGLEEILDWLIPGARQEGESTLSL